MKTWISSTQAVPDCVSRSEDEESNSSSPKSAFIVKGESPSLGARKSTHDAFDQPEITAVENRAVSKAESDSSEITRKPLSTPHKVKTGRDTGSLPSVGSDKDIPEIELNENKGNDEAISALPVDSALSKPVGPLPLHLIQVLAQLDLVQLHPMQASKSSARVVKSNADESGLIWSTGNTGPSSARHDLHGLSSKFGTREGTESLSVSGDFKDRHSRANPHSIQGYKNADISQGIVEVWRTRYLEPSSTQVSQECLHSDTGIHSDINPENGEFLDPVVHPQTVQSVVEGPCRDYNDIGWRHVNMTAELHIKRERKSRMNVLQMQTEQDDHKQEPLAASAAPKEPPWPDAKCVIRPATPADFAQIAEIMNKEASNECDPQIFQDELTTVQDISRIFDACAANSRPFIVVTPAQVNFLDQSKWPKDSDDLYQEFAKYMAANPRPDPSVYGFAFITDYRTGLHGGSCPASRFNGQVRLVVHPNQGRKLYGSALLDRILLCVSPFHRNSIDYVWDCENPKGVYEFPATYNKRQYTQLYLEHFYEQVIGPEYVFKAAFARKFDFRQVGHLRNAVFRTDDQENKKWLNMVLWQVDLTPVSKIPHQG
jgi:L-amino acid N-acyltransferase YncA